MVVQEQRKQLQAENAGLRARVEEGARCVPLLLNGEPCAEDGACGGHGRFQIDPGQTPAQFAGNVAFRLLDIADFWAKGSPPLPGGWFDQPHDLTQAVQFAWADEEYYKREKLGHLAVGAARTGIDADHEGVGRTRQVAERWSDA